VADGKFTKKGCDEGLITALLAGATVEAAARTAGCSESTARRRVADPVFAARLKRERAALLERLIDRLSSIGRLSADTLFALLKSNSERIRLNAAKTALNALFQGKQVLELAHEIEELKRAVGEIVTERQSLEN
jgi:hypothetical protein